MPTTCRPTPLLVHYPFMSVNPAARAGVLSIGPSWAMIR